MRARSIGVLLLLSVPCAGQHGSTNVVNPYTRPEDAAAGAKLYRAQCASCHGIDGTGTSAGPGLTSGSFRHGGSDEALFQTISKGIPGTPMPAFALSGLQTWQLVTYLRSLIVRRAADNEKGDVTAGAALFRANCSQCHIVRGEGGVDGPDLSTVGSRLSGAELRKALADPDANVSSEYWTIAIKTGNGQTLRGARLNEDTHSMQLRDERGRLISVWKRDIGTSELSRKSPMPSFSGKLSKQEIDNLIAYLTRLREEQ